MKTKAADPVYWEAWARDLGWDSEKVQMAGRVGSLAVSRGMAPDQALDVVLARVRDGKNVSIGPGPFQRLVRNEGLPALICGAIAFLAVGVGRTGESVATVFPVMFTALLALEIFFVIGGFVRRAWRLTLLGLAMTIAAIAVLVAPSYGGG